MSEKELNIDNEQISFNVDPEELQTFGNEQTPEQKKDRENFEDEGFNVDRKRVKKTRTQGLSMSDIPNNVFQGDQINSFKQDSDAEEHKETINFGFGSSTKINPEEKEVDAGEGVQPITDIDHDFLNNLLSNPAANHDNLYGEENNNDVQYIVSPLKDSTYEPLYTHSPEQKVPLDEMKNNTCEFKDALKSDQQISARGVEIAGLTERVNYNPGLNQRNSHLQIPNNSGLITRPKNNENGFYTQRYTTKSDSSWMPHLSKYEHEEETELDRHMLDNVALSTSRMSYLKSVRGANNTREEIKQYIDVDPKKISAILEGEKPQLASLKERCDALKKAFEDENDFYKKCFGAKIDMERRGKECESKIDQLFDDFKSTNEKLERLTYEIQTKEENCLKMKEELDILIEKFMKDSAQWREAISKDQKRHNDLTAEIHEIEDKIKAKNAEYDLLEQSALKNQRSNRLIFMKDEANIEREQLHRKEIEISIKEAQHKMNDLYDELRRVKERKKNQRISDIENKICIELYRIFLDSNLNEDISIDQGISSLLYGIEKVLIKTNQAEKEIKELQAQRNELKKKANSSSLGSKAKLSSQFQSEMSKLSWISNIQVVLILGILTAIAMLLIK
ncbi:unnamed protein product [Moneuplotes crassus]|uniref:Uncharacterized protein n=1 Tax=Euplotes crassus TaxID=5936 RepID=A0AAD1U1P2_EUPCR|nr:unnamed protein product [Moneuplotes crassus]